MRSGLTMRFAVGVAVLAGTLLAPVHAVRPPGNPVRPGLDIRRPPARADRAGFVLRSPTSDQYGHAAQLATAIPGLVLRWDGLSAAPKWVASRSGHPLSASRSGAPDEVARSFLAEHAVLFGLTAPEIDQLTVSSVVAAPDGGSHVHFVQMAGRLEVFGGRSNVNLAPDGAIRSVGSILFAGIEPTHAISIEAAEAVRSAVRDVYPQLLFTGVVESAERDGARRTVFVDPVFGRKPTARLVLFPDAAGARIAWDVRVAERSLFTDYQLLIDAADGTLLWRRNRTLYASARIIQGTAPVPQTEEFLPDNYSLVTVPSSTPESPGGWIAGSGLTLAGNNATSHPGFWNAAGLGDPAGVYDYPFNTPRSGLVNAWYWANDAHDRFYAAGFDEAAGNYQTDNFGNGGVQGDAMAVVQWTVGGRDNASYTQSVDGDLSTINFYWAGAREAGDHDGYPENGGERDTGFMREVIVHEYGHGVSIRMVGGPADDSCLFGVQSGGMGEGWSDLFAASFYDDPQIGDYFFEGSGFMRDLRHDLTYADLCEVSDSSSPFNNACQVHADGMIWAGTLWELRGSMAALDPAAGRTDFEQLVVEGLASTPCSPTMIDARDGLLTADTTLFGGSHHGLIWNVFASRGMGETAASLDHDDETPTVDFNVPVAFSCTAPGPPTGLAAAAEGNNAVRLNYTASGAAAVEIWRSDSGNPFDRPVKIGSTDNSSTFLDDSVQGGRNYEYSVVALGSGGTTCKSTVSSPAAATAAGSCDAYPVLDPDLTATADIDCTLNWTWNAALDGCAGQPVVYNIYRGTSAGFPPSARRLIGRTSSTAFQDRPPGDGTTAYYLVTAQHGTLDDAADHRLRGSSQLMEWAPGLPTSARTTVRFWDFESGLDGWTIGTNASLGDFERIQPSGTSYAGALFGPDEAAGGSGFALVTGGAPSTSITERDSDRISSLESPEWDSAGGATIVSFDYWQHFVGRSNSGIAYSARIPGQAGGGFVSSFSTHQRFDTAARHGWQRVEIDIGPLVPPSAGTDLWLTSRSDAPLSEYGIDNVRVEQAAVCGRSALAITDVTLDDTPPGWGNGNGVLEPGETARLTVSLINNGSTTATTPGGTLIALPEGVIAHEPTDSFPTMGVSGGGSSTGNGFTVTLGDDADCHETINFGFEFADAEGTRSTGLWTFEYGSTVTETIFEDDFETDKGWLVSGAGSGEGVWEREDPVGTANGSIASNPEDCADGPGTLCYVTENGSNARKLHTNDVDAVEPILNSPLLDFTGYKRSRLHLDFWFYDTSTSSDYWQDYASFIAWIDDGIMDELTFVAEGRVTNGWEPQTVDLTTGIPHVADVQVQFRALDRDETYYSGAEDHAVEMGVDNVVIEGDRQVCSVLGVNNAPNSVGDSLRVDRGGGAEVAISWSASAVDGSHDAPAYYRLYVSGMSGTGFAVADTATAIGLQRVPSQVLEYFRVTAVNDAGTSGDEPAP